MPMLMLTCPSTGQQVPTGIAVEGGLETMRMENNSVGCPACGGEHVWSLVAGEVVVHR